METVSLASSSKGNCYLVIASGGEVLMIDDGLSFRELSARLDAVNDARLSAGGCAISLDRLQGVIVTHSHTDHVHGLGPLLKRHEVPVFANLMTGETVIAQEKLGEEAFVYFENGQEFAVGPFSVLAFSIPHDTSDPVGYVVKADGLTYFHGTDIGRPMRSIGIRFAEADIATLESNHDPVMLSTSGRAPSLIQRIRGGRGHLTNDEAAEFVREYASPRLRKLSLAHLSRDCNAPHIAERTMRSALASMHREDIELEVLSP